MNTIIRTFINKIFTLAITGLFCFTSCNDFLDRDLGDAVDVTEVFSNIDNAEAFLNNAYNFLTDQQRITEDGGGRYKLGTGTDEMAFQQGYSDKTPYDWNFGNWNASSFPMERCWADYYGCIRRINIFIQNYDLIPEEVTVGGESNRKKRMLGEAHALRAFYYFELFRMWGEVPLIDQPLEPADKESTMLTRSPIEDVIQFIANDIDKAIELLPPKHNSSEYGRFTSVAAHAMKSRLYLYHASPLWNTSEEVERWTKAAETTKTAIDYAEANGYHLSTTDAGDYKAYERIFLEPNNPEVILTKTNTGEPLYWDYYSVPIGYGGWYVNAPLQEMVDSYEMLNGELPVLGYDENENQIVNPKSGYDPQNPYVDRDPRFYQSILYHGAMWQGRAVDISTYGRDNTTVGAIPRCNIFQRKYIAKDHNLPAGTGNFFRRFAIIRLAELYLNYAEALNESQGPTNEVYNYINTIRSRVGMIALPSGLNKDQMRKRIQNEKKIELAFEEHRFWDVRRWKIAEIVDNGKVHKVAVDENGKFSYPVFQKRVFDKNKHYLFPIHQDEIDKNPKLTQNPGWEIKSEE